jgi:sec-independent protein translocase protein TatC
MPTLFKKIWTFITAPFRWIFRGIFSIVNKTFLGDFLAEDPEDTPILDTIQKATDDPMDFLDSLLEHLTALRKHLFRAVAVLILTSILSFIFITNIMEWLSKPIGGIEELQAIEVTESIGVVMRITFLSGFVIALPYLCFEILRFVAPGISRKARLIGLFGIPFVGVFFVAGLLFAYQFMLNPALKILLNFMGIQTLPRPNSYFRFVTSLMFWIGMAFEFPLVAYVLSSMGIITAQTLRDHWRLAFIILAILAAMITPTVDPINMMIVLLPLWLLYGLSIVMASIGHRKPKEPLPQ